MLINWFTVFAQVINFLILVWLLKRFLYKPILKAIAERENQITAKLKDAEAKKSEAENERDEFLKKNREFAQQRNDQWNQAVDEIKTKKQLLLEEALKESEALREKLKTTFKEEQKNLSLAIMRKTQAEVFSIAGKILKELADDTLEQRIVSVFIKRLNDLVDEEKKKLSSAFSTSKHAVMVSSTFHLIPSQQKEIEKTLKEMLGNSIELTFKTNPEMISGIELHADGYKLSWSISEYLSSIEKNISETIYSKLQVYKKENNKEDKG
ncbi:MAG TPA: F0F1 ATP synthase subunit delta [Bacteroidales bacterium]|nr:F0F1 ATP synthase subunit delta [Bacteroidales bacterium]HPS17193.1 F0F1 ATP synthase subunit delta [Bacteroidales bacterium]